MEVADYCFFDMKNSQQKILEDTQLDTLSKFIKIISALPEIYKDKGLNNVHLLKDKYPAVYKKIIDYLTAEWNVALTLLNKEIEEEEIINKYYKPKNKKNYKIHIDLRKIASFRY